MTILDLLQQRGLTPVRVANTHGGEYASPCPACGGRDRFRVWPEQREGGTWYCRAEDKGGDRVQFLREFDGLSYADACARLGVERRAGASTPLRLPGHSRAERPFMPKESAALPPEAWREHAARLLDHAHAMLLTDAGQMAALAARGLTPDAVKRFRLGWLPSPAPGQGTGRDCYFRDRAAWGLPPLRDERGKPRPLWIPSGLVIPALSPRGEVLRLRVRRPDASRAMYQPDMKFVVIPGSAMHPLLQGADARAFVVVESELDAMACAAAAEAAGLDVGALAVGTNLGKPDLAAHATLLRALAILVALDFDAPKKDGKRPGAQGYGFWASHYRAARRWPVPQGKDPGEAVAQGVDLALWLRSGLPPVFRLNTAETRSTARHEAPAPVSTQAEETMPFGLSVNERGGEFKAEPKVEPHEAEKQGHGPYERPADWLTTPLGPLDSPVVLARAGLRAEPWGDDYKIRGHESWPLDDEVRLLAWLRRYGDWVADALRQMGENA